MVDDALLDPSGVFKKLCSTLPHKAGVSEEGRAANMANALAWMMEKGLVRDSYDSVLDFETTASFLILKLQLHLGSQLDLLCTDPLIWMVLSIGCAIRAKMK